LKLSFPWVSISPKLHILFRHGTDFLSRFGSVGLYCEQSIEACHGFYNQNAAQYSSGTEADGCANLVRAMAVAREESDSSLVRTTRRPAKAGERKAAKIGDRRLRVNKGGFVESQSSLDNAVKEGRQWARSIFVEGDWTFETVLTRLARG